MLADGFAVLVGIHSQTVDEYIWIDDQVEVGN